MTSRSDVSSFEAMRLDERILLEQRLLGKRKAGSPPATIPRRTSGSPCALSFAQSRLWLVEQINPVAGNYNIAQTYRILGTLDVEALRAALEWCSRHEVFVPGWRSATHAAADVAAHGRLLQLLTCGRSTMVRARCIRG
jgi:hypothetical protein